MENEHEHWRMLTSLNYLRAECFIPKEKKVFTIKEVKSEKLFSTKQKEEKKPVLYFIESELPMVINVTNGKVIEKLYGGEWRKWIGKKIQIFATNTKVAVKQCLAYELKMSFLKFDEVQYLCSVCGKTIAKDFYDKSIAKHGKPYCSKECLEQDTQGENLL